MEIIIQQEEAKDYRRVEEVTRAAFSYPARVERGGIGCPYEHWMVHELRKRDGILPLSLVAKVQGRLVGHLICSKGVVRLAGREIPVLNFGPVSVLPEYQRKGIGKALITDMIARAGQLGYGAILFFGRPEYYPQFGFQEASEYGVTDAFGENYPAFMAMELIPGYLAQARGGKYFESDIYDDEKNRETVKEFERGFQKAGRIRGGLYGLLAGDALGVPYEFHSADELPSYSEIEMTPPEGFLRAHRGVEPGTWSDDGAQALCLLDSLIACKKFCLKDFSDRLLAWYEKGKWAVDGVVFDVGIQTGEALSAYRARLAPEKCGLLRPDGKGNGALMRVLPLVLWHKGTERELVADAHAQCLITHGNVCNQVCCALYCLVARFLLEGMDFGQAVEKAVPLLREIYREMPEYEQELEWSVRPDEPWAGGGSGYVVDCLRSAFMIMGGAASYEEAVKQAVLLGGDTDTTACVTGGLAGILFGFEAIPERWYNALKGREDVEGLLESCAC